MIHLAVQQFDVRPILRALRALSTLRKRFAVEGSLPADGNCQQVLKSVREARIAVIGSSDQTKQSTGTKKGKKEIVPLVALLPEEEVYLSILEQVRILDRSRRQPQLIFAHLDGPL